MLLELTNFNKKIKVLDYEYIKMIMNFMSPKEFQNFKNGISGIANSMNVQINSINEGESTKVGEYNSYLIKYEILSNYENFINFKKKLSETEFKINLTNEIVTRENPESSKVLVVGSIEAYIFENKENFLKKNEKLIEEMSKKEKKLKIKSDK